MSGSVTDHVEALRSRGYTVVDGVMSPAEVDVARRAIDEIFAREAPIAECRRWRNSAHIVSYMLPAKHPFFGSFTPHPSVLALARAVLGVRCTLSSMNGFSTMPRGTEQPLHIDQRESTPGHAISLNVVHALDDFNRENGSTRLVPGSHQWPWTRDGEAMARGEAAVVQLDVPAGSAIVYNSGLWHGGGRNSTDAYRRAIHTQFAREWVVPEWDFRRSLPEDVKASLTEEQRRLFGFATGPSCYDCRADRELPAGHEDDRGIRRRFAIRLFGSRFRKS